MPKKFKQVYFFFNPKAALETYLTFTEFNLGPRSVGTLLRFEKTHWPGPRLLDWTSMTIVDWHFLNFP